VSRSPGLEEGDRGGGRHRRRRRARRLAIDILYQADVTDCAPSEVVANWLGAGRAIPDYTVQLVTAVEADRDQIDEALGTSSEGWTVHRMAVVDRTILRVACAELRAGVPPAVAINEAVEAANELSTQDSGRFINGVLGKIARTLEGADPAGDA
jgi:N utilization substance protein B